MAKDLYIVFPQYDEKIHATKDPGVIATMLRQRRRVVILCTGENLDPTCRMINETEICQGDWLPTQPAIILIYHGGKIYLPLIRRAKAGGHRVIIKTDTDGHLLRKIYNPFSPEMPPVLRSVDVGVKPLLRHWLRMTPWGLRQWAEKRGLPEADYIIVETSMAYQAFSRAFPDFRETVLLIPNGAFFSEVVEPGPKKNTVIAVGRWEDLPTKHPELLIKTIDGIARTHPAWNFMIVGSYDRQLGEMYDRLDSMVRNRITLMGPMEHSNVIKQMESCKILLSTSRWESFALVGAEALSRGCSLVCTPTAMATLTAGGLLGTVADGWTAVATVSALATEMKYWELQLRNPRDIICAARPLFDWQLIINKLETLCR
ncbi:MAG TPA: glycosyltransferase family 4 protein [Patescibacteria group bacterium]|nr:glycosyltransferase family 4 protein [Patescibacteria group bacterium]